MLVSFDEPPHCIKVNHAVVGGTGRPGRGLYGKDILSPNCFSGEVREAVHLVWGVG